MRSLLTAAAISLAFTLFLTPVFLRLFRAWGWGQVIRTPENVHNPSHSAKRGTVTMGGTIFIAGTIVGYLVGTFVGANPPTISGWLVVWMMVGFGAVGFIDDFMKVRSQRSLGLSGWRKVLGQVLVAVPFGIVALMFPNAAGQTPASPYISVFRDVPWLGFMTLGVVVGTDVVGDGLEAVPAGVADAALQREAAEGRRGLPGARGSGGGPRRVRRGTQSKRGRRERG